MWWNDLLLFGCASGLVALLIAIVYRIKVLEDSEIADLPSGESNGEPEVFKAWGQRSIPFLKPTKICESENTPGQSDGGIEKPKHRSDNGLGWDNLGFHGSPEIDSGSQTLDQDQEDSDRRLNLLRKVTDGGPVFAASHDTLPSGITPQTPLCKDDTMFYEETKQEARDREIHATYQAIPLAKENTERPLAKENTERPLDLSFSQMIKRHRENAKPIPRKKAWSWELRQALGKKSKLKVAQWLVFCLFGEQGRGGSIDFMKTGDMVAKVMGSDLYLKWRIETGDDISRNTIERALGRRA